MSAAKSKSTPSAPDTLAARESRNIAIGFLALVGVVIFWLWVFFGIVAPMMGG